VIVALSIPFSWFSPKLDGGAHCRNRVVHGASRRNSLRFDCADAAVQVADVGDMGVLVHRQSDRFSESRCQDRDFASAFTEGRDGGSVEGVSRQCCSAIGPVDGTVGTVQLQVDGFG